MRTDVDRQDLDNRGTPLLPRKMSPSTVIRPLPTTINTQSQQILVFLNNIPAYRRQLWRASLGMLR